MNGGWESYSLIALSEAEAVVIESQEEIIVANAAFCSVNKKPHSEMPNGA